MIAGFSTNQITMNKLSEQVLSMFGSCQPDEKLITDIILLLHIETGIESVGIRLKQGLDFPYYFTRGFTYDFVEKEMYLCSRDSAGELIRDSKGNPHLECMCGNVICGRTDPSLPFFTANGSFWTNSTTKLLASTTDKERQTRTRNRCNGVGYESVALVPIKTNNVIYGLVQLNDRRRNLYTEKLIIFMEGIAVKIGSLFLLAQQERARRHHN
ncbi:hypothetical protein ACFL6N_00675 [Thermodesulfobacteriota bacterium]